MPRSLSQVVQYYQYSADKGNVDAQTAVAQVLNYGTYGVERDHVQVGGERGDGGGRGPCPCDAMMMDTTLSVPPTRVTPTHLAVPQAFSPTPSLPPLPLSPSFLPQALHYFERAATQGDVAAMAHLGHMHANGHGTPRVGGGRGRGWGVQWACG